MKKILLAIAAVALPLLVSCGEKPGPEPQPTPQEWKLNLTASNFSVPGLAHDYIVLVDNAGCTVNINADYMDKAETAALEVDITGLENGVSAAYEKVFNYSTGATQKVTFTKGEETKTYTMGVTLSDPDPHFVSASINDVAVSGGAAKLPGSTDLTATVFTFAVAPEGTKVFLNGAEVASGDVVDFSDKVNGVNFTLKCESVEKTANIKVETTGISGITRVWGHYVKPVTVSDDWFGTKVTDALDACRNIAMNDEYIFLSKDKTTLADKSTDPTGVYAISISDPDNVKLMSRNGIVDGERFFSVGTIDDKAVAASFVMAAGGHLRLYQWDNVDADPAIILDWVLPEAMRLGDKFTVEGSSADGSLLFFDVTSGQKVVRFSMKGGKISTTPDIIDLDTKVGNYCAFSPWKDGMYFCWGGGNQNLCLFEFTGTSGVKAFEFDGAYYGKPVQSPMVITYHEEDYLAYIELKNSFQDGEFRVKALLPGEDYATIFSNPDCWRFGTGDPEEREITAVKNGNGLGCGAHREIGGHCYYAAYVPGSGLSLFELR